ncbi:PREDICTED: protein Asterix [Calidris pugnax]|nr:PREDICTED: protein Asterix [Calidris pugnax]
MGFPFPPPRSPCPPPLKRAARTAPCPHSSVRTRRRGREGPSPGGSGGTGTVPRRFRRSGTVPRGLGGGKEPSPGCPQAIPLCPQLKWCAWIAVYCSFISFANSRSSEDTKQMMSSFMLSISAVVMSYLQNPQPMSPPW